MVRLTIPGDSQLNLSLRPLEFFPAGPVASISAPFASVSMLGISQMRLQLCYPIKRGDIVTLIGIDGSEEITAEQVAFSAEIITNELFGSLSYSRLKKSIPGFLKNSILVQKRASPHCQFANCCAAIKRSPVQCAIG